MHFITSYEKCDQWNVKVHPISTNRNDNADVFIKYEFMDLELSAVIWQPLSKTENLHSLSSSPGTKEGQYEYPWSTM